MKNLLIIAIPYAQVGFWFVYEMTIVSVMMHI